jgi:hypothetical protein
LPGAKRRGLPAGKAAILPYLQSKPISLMTLPWLDCRAALAMTQIPVDRINRPAFALNTTGGIIDFVISSIHQFFSSSISLLTYKSLSRWPLTVGFWLKANG